MNMNEHNDLQTNQLRELLTSQNLQHPSPAVKARLMTGIRAEEPDLSLNYLQWGLGVLVTLLLSLFLWLAIKPGVVVEWASYQDVEAYRVYKTPAGEASYQLISEVHPEAPGAHYVFIDPLVLPGRDYQYKIEGIQAEGEIIHQEIISENTGAVLPAQVGILLSSLFLSLGYLLLTSLQRPFRRFFPYPFAHPLNGSSS
jgi:hypothetical protein